VLHFLAPRFHKNIASPQWLYRVPLKSAKHSLVFARHEFKKCGQEERSFVLKVDERRERRVARQSCGFLTVRFRVSVGGKSGIESDFMLAPVQ